MFRIVSGGKMPTKLRTILQHLCMYKMVVEDELPPSNVAEIMKRSRPYVMRVVSGWRKKGVLKKKQMEARQIIWHEEIIKDQIKKTMSSMEPAVRVVDVVKDLDDKLDLRLYREGVRLRVK